MPGVYSSGEQQTAPGTAMENSARYLYNSVLHDSATKDLPSDVTERESAVFTQSSTQHMFVCVRVYTASLCFSRKLQESKSISISVR